MRANLSNSAETTGMTLKTLTKLKTYYKFNDIDKYMTIQKDFDK